MKRDLHTLYIKYDGNFKTLSKIALAQLILQITHVKGDGSSKAHIITEVESVLSSGISKADIEDAIKHLIKENKLHQKFGKHYIHGDYKKKLDKEKNDYDVLHERILNKYFGKAESDKQAIKTWFQDTTIKFFDKFSYEWFFQITHKKKNGSINIPNLQLILNETLLNATDLKEADKEWLKQQYLMFIESEESDENLLFWQYGISMFSSRLITARNYADKFAIDLFKESMFILDTNILMILDLEEHEINKSLEAFEKVLEQLKITPVYLHVTREEYSRAMEARRRETIDVFDNYDIKVLQASKCPFIQTALKRGCTKGEDVKRMFDSILDVPKYFHEKLKLNKEDYEELAKEVEKGQSDEDLKEKINEAYKKRTKRDKRYNAKMHDAGMISAAHFIRKTKKCWIVTNDSTLKLYAIENCLRNDHEIAVGLDVILGVMAVNSGGVAFDASNFAPLFKNLIKLSLIPESDAFEVRDLAFILNSNTKVNELPEDRVIEVAREIKRRRIAGEDAESLSLFLRRVIEGDKITLTEDIAVARQKEQFALEQKENSEKEKSIFIDNYRIRRRGELRDKYDGRLLLNRILMFSIPVIIAILLYLTYKYLLADSSPLSSFIISFVVEIIVGIVPLMFIRRKIRKKYSEYVNGIELIIDKEIFELKTHSKE